MKLNTKYGTYNTTEIDGVFINYPLELQLTDSTIYQLEQLITTSRKLLNQNIYCIYYNKIAPEGTQNAAIKIVAEKNKP